MAGGSDFFRGLARGGLADLIGGPVDLAQAAANLGIMGVGLAGHKLGLLTPEQMPEPLSGSVGTSDWFAKGTPLADTGTGEYTAGRMVGNFAPSFPAIGRTAVKALDVGLAGPLPGSATTQRGALTLGGDPGLIVSHGKHADNMLKGPNQELSREFTNLSNAITRDKLSHEFGSTFFIPRIGQFDPKTDNTSLRLHDFYTARRGAGQRIDNLRYDLTPQPFHGPDERQQILKGLADARLADKFYTQYAKGGLWSEGVSPATKNLPRFGESGPPPAPVSLDSFQSLLTQQSPAFQSFDHFQNSPIGGQLLGKGSASSDGSRLESTAGQLLHPILDSWGNSLNSDRAGWIKRFAAGFQNPGEKTPTPIDYSRLFIRDGGDLRNMNPEEIRQLQTAARQVMQGLKRSPSNYAELKSWGTTPIVPDRFAGILVPDGTPNFAEIQAAGNKRGIPAVSYRSGEEFDAAVQMQKDAQNRPFLMRGLGDSTLPVSAAKKSILDAQPKTAPVAPENFQNVINYVSKPWPGDTYPLAHQLQKDFNISEEQAHVLSDLAFAHNMKGKYGDHWQPNIDDKLAELAKWTQPKIPVGQATELAGPIAQDPATLPGPVTSFKPAPSIGELLQSQDYVADKQMPELYKLAEGKPELVKLLDSYKHMSQVGSPLDHDNAFSLVQKAFHPGPAQPIIPPGFPPGNPFLQMTTSELMDFPMLGKTDAEWDLWTKAYEAAAQK